MTFGLSESCEDEVVRQLVELRRAAAQYAQKDGRAAADEFFYAEQNARLVKNVEEYYRTMFGGRAALWNLRDRHMAETLDALVAHLDQHQGSTKVVVWAHNSHLGDARATEMGQRCGQLNLGQFIRQAHGDASFLVGFSTYIGTVTAASNRVIYRPETERTSPDFQAQVTAQFNAMLHFDETRAVEPLERAAPWQAEEAPETYPSAL